MATKSGANAAGTNAGQVYVSLRADTTQLEADLQKAQGKVGQFASGGTLGGAAAEGAKEAARANDTLISSSKKAADTVRGDAAYLAREVRRDYRQMGAELKDQMGDVTAFSGKGLADALFGIDKDKIAVTRAVQSLSDLESKYQSGQISQELYTKESEKHATVIDNMGKKYSGATGALRGLGATLVSSLGSSLLIGAGIGVATTALSALVDVGSQIVDKLVNPAKYAAAAFNDLAAAISKVGGTGGMSALLSNNQALMALVKEAEAASTIAKSNDILTTVFGAAGASGAAGMNATQIALKEGSDRAAQAILDKYTNILGVPFASEAEIRRGAVALGKGSEFDRLMAEMRKDENAMIAGANTAALAVLQRLARDVYTELMGPGGSSGARQQQVNELLAQRNAITAGPYAGATPQIVGLGVELRDMQARLAGLNAASTAASAARTIADARLALARASVAGANDTIFDVAIRRSEAQENLRRAREDAARQRAIVALQTKIAEKSEKLQRLEKLVDIDAKLAELNVNIGKIANPTPEPITAQEKDAVSSAIRTIYDYAAQKGLRMVPK